MSGWLFLWTVDLCALKSLTSKTLSAFSIIFEKKFAVDTIWHGEKNIRISNLLSMFALNDRDMNSLNENEVKGFYLNPLKKHVLNDLNHQYIEKHPYLYGG